MESSMVTPTICIIGEVAFILLVGLFVSLMIYVETFEREKKQ